MIYSYEQFIAILEYLNDVNRWDRKQLNKERYKLNMKRNVEAKSNLE